MRYIIFLAVVLSVSSVQADTGFNWPHIQPKKIGEHSYVIEHGPHDEDKKISHGFHNNPGFIITNSGVVVIDTGSSYEIGKMILRKIASVTSKPITHVFTTHFHGDHWFGNQAIVEAYPNVLTIAHPNLIKLLNSGGDKFWLDVFSKRLGHDFAGTKAIIPSTPAKNKIYKVGGVTFQVKVFEKAHTATDIMVYVVEDKILFTGDIINNKSISFMGHGNFKGAYNATQEAIAMKPRYVVAGHGKSGNIELIKDFAYIYKTIRSEVKKYYEQGLMAYEMKDKIAIKLSKYKHWNNFNKRIGEYVSQVNAEIEDESFDN